MTPTHSPPSGIAKDTEPFFQPTDQQGTNSPVKRTGPDTDAALQRSAGKLQTSQVSQEQVSSERTGPDVYASQHQSAGKLKPEHHRSRSTSSRRTGPDAGVQPQSTGKPMSDLQTLIFLSPDIFLPAKQPPTDLHLTDQFPLLSLVRNHPSYQVAGETVFQVLNLTRTVRCRISPQFPCL